MRVIDLTWPVRVFWLVTGLMWFVWLGVEDRGVLAVLLLATVISFSASLTGLQNWTAGKRFSRRGWWGWWLLMGGLWAVAIGPLTVLLMAVKTSLHSHAIPDFSLHSVEQVIKVWPVWGAGALFVSLGLGFFGQAGMDKSGL